MKIKINGKIYEAEDAQVLLGDNTYFLSEQQTDNPDQSLLKVGKVSTRATSDVLAIVPTGAVNSIFIK